jgi:hypothetical protein
VANLRYKRQKVLLLILKPHKVRGKLIQPGNLKKAIGAITGKQENPTVYAGPRAKGNFMVLRTFCS